MVLTKKLPTAKQLVLLADVTPVSTLTAEPGAFGVDMIDQRLPSHRIARVLVTVASVLYWPTAMQLVVLEHLTLVS